MKEVYRQNNNERWGLKEGEMTESQLRNLGHLLYVSMFTRMPEAIRSALAKDHQCIGNDPKAFDVRTVPAELYVEKFATLLGLNVEVVKRWANNASIEIANGVLLAIPGEDGGSAADQDATDYVNHTESITEPINRVSQHGLRALVQDHRVLVGEAFYMGTDTNHYTPLNPSLVEDVFYDQNAL